MTIINPIKVEPCDHATARVPVCSCCFHLSVYLACKTANLAERHCDEIADYALLTAVQSGMFLDD